MPLKTALLEQIGLTKAEINVYLALLELGSSTTGPIVEKSQASSSKIYEILEKLLQKGLASFVIKNGMKFFEASDPQRLLDYLKEKETELKTQEQELQQMLPELELKRTLSKYKSEATIYKGMKGLETAFQDIFKTCKEGDTNYVFVVGQLDQRMNEFFKRHYTLRAKQGIKTKTIFSEAGRDLYQSRKNIPLFEGKVVGTTTSPATVTVYGTKVNLRMGESKNVICVVIDNKELADSFLEQFNLLWNQDIRVYKGFDEVLGRFKSMLGSLQAGEEYQVLGASHGEGGKRLVDWFMKYHQERIKQKVKARLLAAAKDYEAIIPQMVETGDPQMTLSALKVLPPEFSSPMQINLYPQNKVLMFLWGKELICFEIESGILHQNFKNYFEALWNQQTFTYYGYEGLQTVIKDTLNHKEVLFIGAGGYVLTRMPEFWREHNKTRLKRKILWKGLAREEILQSPLPKEKLFEYKLMPKAYQTPNVVWIFGDKVANILWLEQPIAFVIENKDVANGYREYFGYLWKTIGK